MPDISMCKNGDCPLRAACYRYRAIPNPEWQTYSWFEPVTDEYTRCLGFLEIEDHDRIRSMEEIEEKK